MLEKWGEHLWARMSLTSWMVRCAWFWLPHFDPTIVWLHTTQRVLHLNLGWKEGVRDEDVGYWYCPCIEGRWCLRAFPIFLGGWKRSQHTVSVSRARHLETAGSRYLHFRNLNFHSVGLTLLIGGWEMGSKYSSLAVEDWGDFPLLLSLCLWNRLGECYRRYTSLLNRSVDPVEKAVFLYMLFSNGDPTKYESCVRWGVKE